MKYKTTHSFMRAAVLLLVMMLTMAQTAWADDPAWLKPGDSWDETTKTLTVNTATVVDFAYQNHSEIEHVIISNDVTSIGPLAFAGCTNLKTVFVGNGVTSIGDKAFSSCTNLKAVFMTRTSSAPSLSGDPFYASPNLKIYVPVDKNGNILSVYQSNDWSSYIRKLCASWSRGTCAAGLNDGVLTVVGFGAFENCIGNNSRPNINSIVIEEGVTSIGDGAFSHCDVLTSVEIPANVTSIGDGAFSSCGSLATITVDENNQAFDSPEGCNAIIRTADNALVAGCKNTVIPDGVQSIVASAFEGCSGLTSITIPNSVTSIGAAAYHHCSNLESVNIGSGVTSIAISAFNVCHKLATITVDVNNQTFDSPEGSNAIIRKADNTLVAGCKTTVIPDGVQSIGDQAFYGNDGLTSITIPNSVTSIGGGAFGSCSGLTSIAIPASVTSIGISAFSGCSNLASVTLNGVATIGENAFETYAPLTTVTIAGGMILYNGTELLSGAITDMSKLNGKTLQRCYSITLPEHVTASGTAGVLNDIIYALPDATVTISAATGYIISNIAVNGSPIEGNSFTMPGEDVTVTADVQKLMTNEDIVITIPEQTYTCSELTPVITVKDGEITLAPGTDYEVTYSNNIDAGTATATITGMGNYTGSKDVTFTIAKATPTVTTPTAVENLIYNGSAQALVNAGNTDFGTLLYSLDGQNYSDDIPTGTDAGTYTVYYKVEGSDNWNAVAAQTIEVTITYFDASLAAIVDNSDVISNIITNYDSKADVTLSDRTLYKDGNWNTLCLPFALSAEQIAANPAFAGAILMSMDVAEKNGFDTEDGTLYLWFKSATAIEAGVPYLVKWEKAADYEGNEASYDISNPVFEGVTISNSTAQTVESKTAGLETVQMVGTYSPVGVTADDKSILFLGDANTLYYSSIDRQIRSCRAYFSVPYIKGHPEAKARAFALNFDGEETTGILEVSAKSNEEKDDVWYSLDGVRLSGKPSQRGMYINKGKKILVKWQ